MVMPGSCCRALVLVCAVVCLAAQDPDTEIQRHFAAAQTAQRNDDLDTAAKEYRAILKLKPDFAEIQLNLGLVLHAQGRIDESAAVLEKSLKLKPDQFAAHLFQGINYCKLGRPGQAVPLSCPNHRRRTWKGSTPTR